MTYQADGETVTLTMSREDYNFLLMALGMATGIASRDQMWNIVSLVNQMNVGNPDFTPYEIPETENYR